MTLQYIRYTIGAQVLDNNCLLIQTNMSFKFKKILFVGYSIEDFSDREWVRIDEVSESKVLLPKNSHEITSQLNDTDCLLVNQGMAVDRNMIDHAPRLKYIGILATGYNKIDVAFASSRNIAVYNVPGYATDSVAEFVYASLFEHIREIERAKQQAKKGNYSEVTFNGIQIKDKTIGIIGLGRIGYRVAQIGSQGFGAKVIYWSRKRKKEVETKQISYLPVDKILREADIISTHLSFAKETSLFFNAQRISMMKPGAIFINFAPMELIDLKALEARLKKGDLTFIMDHPDEMTPTDMKRLRKYKNCVVYPPIGFRTNEASIQKRRIFIGNLERFVTPSNRVN